MSIQHKTTDL